MPSLGTLAESQDHKIRSIQLGGKHIQPIGDVYPVGQNAGVMPSRTKAHKVSWAKVSPLVKAKIPPLQQGVSRKIEGISAEISAIAY